jgi:VanZ family protein
LTHKTSAWPLSLLLAALIVYASLFPFEGWRDQGLPTWGFLWQPLPRYWMAFDVGVNLAGYAVFGFLLAVAWLRGGPGRHAVWFATLLAALLSLAMEGLQSYLPRRVASNVDFALNTAGAWGGAVLASLLHRWGALDRWSAIRGRWFQADARGGMVLLALWPWALLFPTSVPLALGQVLERLENHLGDWLADTPLLEWLPLREIELQPLLPGAELACVTLGGLVPCLLAHSVVRGGRRRAFTALLLLGTAVGVTALSAALSVGPTHAWAWFTPTSRAGLAAAAVLAAMTVLAPPRLAAALAILSLGILLALVNQAPEGAYHGQTLATWEQGRFIRFNGLAQWLGWLWPYGALAYLLLRVGGGRSSTMRP